MRRAMLALCMSSMLLVSPRARAQDAAAAEKLFLDARALMAEGRWSEACPKLVESQRLDPGVGTLLNLAECYEKEGKTASAWATYREAETAASRKGQKERAQFAASRAEALAGHLSDLVIEAPQNVDGLAIVRDGALVGAAAWGIAVPVDPGKHTVVATAPGRLRWEQEIDVAGETHAIVRVPDLVREAPAPLPPPVPAQPAPPVGTGAQKTVGIVAISIGAASLATGLVFGGIALSRNDIARHQHCSSVDCDARGVTLIQQARDAATVSTIAVVTGAGVAALGMGLFLTAPGAPTQVAVVPGGLTWARTW